VAYNSRRLCRRDWSGEPSPSGVLEAVQ